MRRCVVVLVGLSLVSALLTAPARATRPGKTWALLVASANDWWNYGMQADVYHAFQAFREGGIPEEQIIVMAYDDIAQADRNPFKGQVFQSYDLYDVYKGVSIDYKGDTVNKKTFKAILEGDKAAVKASTGRNGKVIDSGPEDNVFVFISNHGSPGHVCWLDGDDMSAKELNQTIQYLHKNNRYNNLVLYIDTCFAGSMFKDILPENIGVYAVTATNSTYYAWSIDCMSAAFGEDATCLGGLFSISWVYQLLSDDRKHSTMNMQYHEAKFASEGKCIPQQYGDLSIGKKTQVSFFGDSAQNKKPKQTRRLPRSAEARSSVAKHLLAYQTLKNQLASMPADSEKAELVNAKLRATETLMKHADKFITDLAMEVYGRSATQETISWMETNFGPINWSCYEPVVAAVRARCPDMMYTEEVRYYAGAKFGVLVNLCNEVNTDTLLAATNTAANGNPLCLQEEL
ncbi:vacuolar-processing enzyme [Elysia marginata]|uniref:Vacuolar-processing enzyme n=1 Tax=Elysia marginata TaxID=1093978 RepID=A0AAV4J9B2_9GAST|nr:vacuolar-processing enzyme [Elysia marginata]